MSFHILGTGSSLPERRVTNAELASFLDTNDEWIVSRSGIHERPICTTETLDDLAYEACGRALADAGVSASELDYIICTTCSAERSTPAQACVVQQMLGASCPSFDINGACAGFIFGLDVANGLFEAGRAQRILLLSAEKMSRMTDWTDRSTAILFGDGAAAAVLAAGGESPLYIKTTTAGDRELIHAWLPCGNNPFDVHVAQAADAPASAGPHGRTGENCYVHMAGREVFKFAVTQIETQMKQLAAESGVALADIDHVVFHQANKRIIDAGVERLGLDPERVILTIDKTANVSSACIPLSLDRLHTEGRRIEILCAPAELPCP